MLAQKQKLFGLTIQPERLSKVRNERRPNSHYASLGNCQYEVAEAERMMLMNGIQFLSSTSKSIEEISTAIVSRMRGYSAQSINLSADSIAHFNLK
ncbi:MAG: kinase/pyrophosphorylase [Oxalobacter sp.]|nr:kinase/pyrophosphorylase [Oxalobacter sp.]